MKLSILGLLLMTTIPASAAPLRFTQNGWDQGGPLTLEFSGTDVDTSGGIDLAELTHFAASFRLPDGSLTAWNLGDLDPFGFLFIDRENLLVFATNSQYSLVEVSVTGVSAATVFDQFLFPVVSTDRPLEAVPEPRYLGVAGLTGLLLNAWLRRQSQNKKTKTSQGDHK